MLAAVLCSCSLNSRIQKADKKFALGEYYRAAEMYRSIYPNVPNKKRSLKGSVAYKMGNSYRLIENNKRAETAYKNAVKFGSKDSLVYYFYAEVLRSNGKYKEAIKMYENGVVANIPDMYDPYTYAGFDGTYDATNKCYRMRITQHLQKLVKEGRDRGTLIVINGRRTSWQHTVINGDQTANPIRIQLVYSE